MLPDPAVGISVADLAIEVLAIAASSAETIPGSRWHPKKLVNVSAVKAQLQRGRVRIIARSIQRTAADIQGSDWLVLLPLRILLSLRICRSLQRLAQHCQTGKRSSIEAASIVFAKETRWLPPVRAVHVCL